MSFFLTLPSNSSFNVFPENKISDYRTKLCKTISFPKNDFEIAVTEVLFPKDILVFHSQEAAWIQLKERNSTSDLKLFLRKNFCVDETIDNLLDHINEVVQGVLKDRTEFILQFDYYEKRVGLSINETKYIVKFSPKLHAVLGFDSKQEEITKVGQVYKATYPPDLRAGSYTGFLYSDIVEPQIVGDTESQVLRVFSLSSSTEIFRTINFINPYYKKLNTSDFDVIRVFLLDESGDPIAFRSGIFTVVFHIRKV